MSFFTKQLYRKFRGGEAEGTILALSPHAHFGFDAPWCESCEEITSTHAVTF